MGAERLADSTILYQWFKDGEMVAEQTNVTFSFTFLTLSDAGSYTCQATVMSSLLSAPITSTSTAFIRELQRQSQIQVVNHDIAPLVSELVTPMPTMDPPTTTVSNPVMTTSATASPPPSKFDVINFLIIK